MSPCSTPFHCSPILAGPDCGTKQTVLKIACLDSAVLPAVGSICGSSVILNTGAFSG